MTDVIDPEVLPETEPAKPMELTILESNHVFRWNVEDAKALVQSRIDKYVGLVVTDDNLKDMEAAQKEVAGIRLKIDSFRKEVKKKFEEPYKVFESEIGDLQQLIAKAEVPLKKQILDFENQRVAKREAELLEFGKKTAVNLGLRDEYFNLVIHSKWTNRSAKKGAVNKEIIKAVTDMLDIQKKADEAAELQRQRKELIEQLCVNNSQVFLLKTPVTPDDVKLAIGSAGLAAIPGIILCECQKRSEMERKAAEPDPVPVTPIEVTPPEQPQQFVQPPTPPAPPRSPHFPPMPPRQPRFVGQMPPPRPVPQTFTAVIEFPSITIAQAAAAKEFYAAQGIQWKVISQEENHKPCFS